MDQRFANKVMVITGAAQGIGQRVAELAAQQGAKLALVDRSPLVQELRDRLAAITDVIAVEVDLETFQGAEQAAEAAFKAFRRRADGRRPSAAPRAQARDHDSGPG